MVPTVIRTNSASTIGLDGCLKILIESYSLVISTMSEELRVYRAYVSFVKRFLLVSGMSPDTGKRCAVYRCLTIWSILSCSVSSLTITYTCTKIITKINLLTRLLGLLITTLNATTKGFCFFIYKKKLGLLNDTLDCLVDKILSKARFGSAAFFLLRTFYRLIYFEAVLMGITSLSLVIKPLLTRLLQDSGNTSNVHYSLPTRGTYPWSVDSPFLWYLHYLFETNIFYLFFCVSMGADAFFGFCMFRMSMILRVLGLELEIISREEDEENRRDKFRDCIRQHVSLFRCRDIIQEIYGPIILLGTMSSAVSMCSLIFQVVQMNEINVVEAGIFLIYFVMKLTQTLIYAWPGCILVSENRYRSRLFLVQSEFLRGKVYCSSWYENRDVNFVKQFTMILIQRPIVVRACCLLEVSLDLFAKVVNTTISYYFLLETINNDT